MEGKAGSTLLLHNVPGTLCDRVLLVASARKRIPRKEFCQAIRRRKDAQRNRGLRRYRLPDRDSGEKAQCRLAHPPGDSDRAGNHLPLRPVQEQEGRSAATAAQADLRRRAPQRAGTAEEALQQGLAIAEGMALAKNLATCRATSAPRPISPKRRKRSPGTQPRLSGARTCRHGVARHGLAALRPKGSHQAAKLIVLQHKAARPATSRSCSSARASPSTPAASR